MFGVRLEQDRDGAPLGETLGDLPFRRDALLGLATLRYTQSNSVCVGKDGMVLGIGAGQQNRVDCTRLAGTKAQTWWLRRHPLVQALKAPGLGRQDLINWQIRFAEGTLTRNQSEQLVELFGHDALTDYRAREWREDLDGAVDRFGDVLGWVHPVPRQRRPGRRVGCEGARRARRVRSHSRSCRRRC